MSHEDEYPLDSEARLESSSADDLPPLPPLWKRVIDVVVSPVRVMQALATNPRPWGALFVGASLVALAGYLIPAEVYEDFIRNSALQRGQPVPENMATLGRVSRISGLVAGPIFWLFWSALIAGVATGIFVFLMGGAGRYKQYFAVTAHALMIPALGGLLMVPLRIANENPQEVLSVGTFFGGLLPEGYPLNVLNSLDLFSLAGFAVLAVGVSQIERGRSWGSAFAVLCVLNVLIAMVFAVFL